MSAEQRDPAAGNDCVEMEGRGEMIKAPVDLQDLRRRLYVKAKAEPSWRFWGIYVHVCKKETLHEAYKLAKANNGAPGIDGVTFEAIEAQGLECFLEQIRSELIQRTYRPLKARQREIPKDGGKVRVLSIPAIRDRVVQGALKLIVEPIFEVDFQPGSYGYRPKRTAHDAIRLVAKSIVREKTRIIDLDLRAYFDSVRHDLLLAKVAQRVSDAEVLHLLKLMLKATGKQGVPQGGVISPVLSNLYLNEVDKMLERAKEATRCGKYTYIEYARYADDRAPRRRGGEFYVLALNPLKRPCCTRDEGGPLNPGCRTWVQTTGCCFGPMAEVVSETGKGRARPCQVSVGKTSASEPPMNCRKRRNGVKTRGLSLLWDQLGGDLFTAQAASGGRGGASSTQALVRNVGTCASMRRERLKRTTRESLSTDARRRDGVVRISDEGSVMELERRGDTVQPDRKTNRQREESFG